MCVFVKALLSAVAADRGEEGECYDFLVSVPTPPYL